jgi:hypothetical protein
MEKRPHDVVGANFVSIWVYGGKAESINTESAKKYLDADLADYADGVKGLLRQDSQDIFCLYLGKAKNIIS